MLTISLRVLSLSAILSLPRPWAARRIILALMTLKYGNVYFVVRLDNSNFSSEVKIMLYGLFLGMGNLLGYHHAINRNIFQDYIRYRIYEKYHLVLLQGPIMPLHRQIEALY
jgi:hypothetical protein